MVMWLLTRNSFSMDCLCVVHCLLLLMFSLFFIVVTILGWFNETFCPLDIQIQQRYKGATGYLPFIFEGSSPGAGKFGYMRIRRRIPAKLS